MSAFYERYKGRTFVRERRLRNVEGQRDPVDEAAFWKALVTSLLTTQQRSGPDSAVAKFTRLEPHPLELARARAEASLSSYVTETLRRAGGIRRYTVIAEELQANLTWLERGGGWDTVMKSIARLERQLDEERAVERERAAADVLAKHLRGLGPKQSRNVLQYLGLTRYEIPIDSRITRWLNDFGFPLKLRAGPLGDPGYYEFVSDGFRALCRRAGVLPCLMDAAIFASFDPERDEDEAAS